MVIKQFIYLLFFLFFYLPLTAQPTEEGHLLGKCNRAQIENNEWFNKEYSNYQPNPEIINQLSKLKLKGYTIQIFFGSWCGDSRREMPRFLKILDQLNFPTNQLELIGLDNGDLLKQSPNHEEKGKGIYRVPTFILSKAGNEQGRIVEYPVLSLERDLLNLVQGGYEHNYLSYAYIYKWQKDGILKDPNVNFRGLLNQLKGKVLYYGELNTVGYVILRQKALNDAILIFRLNTFLFPENANVYDSLGEALDLAGHTADALHAYEMALKLEPKNEHIQQVIEKLKGKSEETGSIEN